MTDELLYTRLLQRAIEQGWDFWGFRDKKWKIKRHKGHYAVVVDAIGGASFHCITEMMFHHEFAKSLWGEWRVCPSCGQELSLRKSDFCCEYNKNLITKYIYATKEDEIPQLKVAIPFWEYCLRELAATPNRHMFLKQFVEDSD